MTIVTIVGFCCFTDLLRCMQWIYIYIYTHTINWRKQTNNVQQYEATTTPIVVNSINSFIASWLASNPHSEESWMAIHSGEQSLINKKWSEANEEWQQAWLVFPITFSFFSIQFFQLTIGDDRWLSWSLDCLYCIDSVCARTNASNWSMCILNIYYICGGRVLNTIAVHNGHSVNVLGLP